MAEKPFYFVKKRRRRIRRRKSSVKKNYLEHIESTKFKCNIIYKLGFPRSVMMMMKSNEKYHIHIYVMYI